MELVIPFQAFSSGGSFSASGGALTSPLYLYRDPVDPLEAATKQYIDTKLRTIPASAVVSGTVSADRFPALIGDVASLPGSGVIRLADTGVSQGIYTKFSVNIKGVVTAASQLVLDDIPNLSWGKFTAGKPTTLAGFGITDGFPKTGGAMDGDLQATAVPTQTLHAANKLYVDNTLGVNYSLAVGDVLRTAVKTTPAGTLRCNGGWLSKATYSSLYAVIGDQHSDPVDPNNFQLPDYSALETEWLKYYIKY